MEPGDHIGTYTIVSEIGEGGMAIVYLAEDTRTNTRVVVKQLREQYTFEQQIIERFLRGATAVKDLRHPHLGRVLEWIERDGRFFTVEQYFAGGTLSDFLKENGPPTQREALTWSRDALRALNYVHEFGIVHRDVKPSNLMLDENRRIQVIDFGIARVFGDIRLTRNGDSAIGTPWYMSPEQIRNVDEIDHLTDVYSMGVVLYELLTGRVPFDGSSEFSIKEKIIHQAPPPIRMLKPGLDPAVEKIVFKALAKARTQRYGGCGEFALALDRHLNPSTAARKTWTQNAVERATSPVRHRPRVALAAAMGAIVLTAGVVVTVGMRSPGIRGVAPPSANIQLAASASPESVDQAGTTVTFEYRVTTSGTAPLTQVAVLDGGPAPLLTGGDVNSNRSLDPGETWLFRSQAAVEQRDIEAGTLARHVIAKSDQVTSERQDIAIQLPRRPGLTLSVLVNGVKSVQVKAQGAVTYSFFVTNTGNIGLTGVRVVDDPGTSPTRRQGDTNGNDVLDVGERWEYRSAATIPAALTAGRTIVQSAVAVSDQLRSPPDQVTVTFAPATVAPPRAATNTNVPVPRKTWDVSPVYPAEAQAAGVQGEVRLEVTIAVTGRVQDVRVVQSTATAPDGPAPQALRDLLENAALAAARQWQYAPSLAGGVAVPVVTTANVRFVLTPRRDATLTPPVAPSTPVHVGGDIKPPAKTRHVAPVYPDGARAARVQGTVVVEATIDRTGYVRDARVVRSIPLLDEAAIDAVRKWEFTPTYLNGMAVPVIMTVNVQFTLN